MTNTVNINTFSRIKAEKKETTLKKNDLKKNDLKKNTLFSVFFSAFFYFSLILISFWFVFHYSLRINASDSLDGLFYLVSPVKHYITGESLDEKGELHIETKSDKVIKRGMIVEVQPPKTAKTSQKISLLKIIKGVPGDVVTERNHSFYINGKYIGDAKSKTASGKRLARGRTGVIPKGHYFIWTPDKDSYDSRYADIDWIPERSILGMGTSLSPFFPIYWGKRGLVYLKQYFKKDLKKDVKQGLKEVSKKTASLFHNCLEWL